MASSGRMLRYPTRKASNQIVPMASASSRTACLTMTISRLRSELSTRRTVRRVGGGRVPRIASSAARLRRLPQKRCETGSRYPTLCVGGVVASARLVERQLWDATKVADIAGQQRQVMMHRGRRDQQIEIGNELASAPQLSAKAGKAFHDRVVERQEREASEKPAKARKLRRGVGSADRAFKELAVGDDADSQAVIAQPGEEIDCCR